MPKPSTVPRLQFNKPSHGQQMAPHTDLIDYRRTALIIPSISPFVTLYGNLALSASHGDWAGGHWTCEVERFYC